MSEETIIAPQNQCPYCGKAVHAHVGQCTAIKSIEYYEDGRIKRVEKFPIPGIAWNPDWYVQEARR